ncbi:MAG: TetR/AcrR family transcriptional regulator [Desulfobacterota bacterium U4-17]
MEQADLRLPRRERERLRQRQEMLSAALELFSEKGYHNVSMHEIAARAEFAIGTLYRFFRNKEDLYRALMLDQAERFHKTLTGALEQGKDELEKLRNYVRAKGELFRSSVSVIRLYLSETQGASFNLMAGLNKEIRKRHFEFLHRLALVFESGMQRGIFRTLARPFVLALALENILNGFLLLWLEDPESHPYPEDPDQILKILLEGLLQESFSAH